MKINIAVYNMEWMKDLFTPAGEVKTSGDDAERGARLANVVKSIAPDFLGVVEGPDTTVSGSRTAAGQLKAWATHHGLHAAYKAVGGFVSGGQQELCALYRSDRISVAHKPTKAQSKHPFNEPFVVDTTESLIKEQYRHYRPPLEITIRPAGGGDELARVIVAHAKSKGIFDRVDMARFEQVSERNRKKLYAECYSIRERVDQWLKSDPGRKVVVMGDINDGFGQDYYEQRFSRSAVETLLGDVWNPDRILRHLLPRPKLGRYGWTPSSSRYTDRITGDTFNVLIDHILLSQNVKVDDFTVWNPYFDHKDDVRNSAVETIKDDLFHASDHYPVSARINL